MNSTATLISNGRLHVNIDYWGRVKDIYFPHIGQENQLGQYINPYYFFYKDQFIYPNDLDFHYEIDFVNDALISKCVIEYKHDWRVEFIDQIDPKYDIHYRDVSIVNISGRSLQLIVYFEHNFSLLESIYADTILWHQPSGQMWHYKKDRHIVFGTNRPFYQFSCAAKDDNKGKGVLPNLKGELDLNPVSTGNVVSTLSYKIELSPHKRKTFRLQYSYATTSSKAFANAKKGYQTNTKYLLQKQILKSSMQYDEIYDIRRFSVLKKVFNQMDLEDLFFHFNRSYMVMCSQIDNRGAVIAGNDGQYLKQGGLDHYSYLWPRDAAMAANALLSLNQNDRLRKVLDHTLSLLSTKGFFHHKYLPSAQSKDIQLGSTWHSYITDQGLEILPIQEDATLFWTGLLIDYLLANKKKHTLWQKYFPYLKKMLKFLIRHTFKNDIKRQSLSQFITGTDISKAIWFDALKGSFLPLPSYDIWEQYFGVFTLDALLFQDILIKTLDVLDIHPDQRLKTQVNDHLSGLRVDIEKYLMNENGVFIKGFRFDKDSNSILRDETADSSMYLVCYKAHLGFNFLPTINYLDSKLFLQKGVGGIARKENDHYLRVSEEITGNPWFICSMWRLRLALQMNDTDFAKRIMQWVLKHFDKTGLIPEQTDPFTGFSLGIKPLTWSHAEYLISIISFIDHLQEKVE